MRQSESIDKLAAALVKAQGAFATVERDRIAKVKSQRTNAEYTYSYATLSAIFDNIRKPLADNGLAITQAVRQAGNKGEITVESMLLHETGQFLSEEITMPVVEMTPQGYGSAITYARRYGIVSLLGIVTDDADDDGAAGSGANRKPGKGLRQSAGNPEGGTQGQDRGSAPRTPAPRSNGAPASKGQIGLIQSKALAAGITDAEVFKKFSLQSLDGISVDVGNEILKFIADPVGYRQAA
jgi:hypothetical protein